jgi:hypothetical protein
MLRYAIKFAGHAGDDTDVQVQRIIKECHGEVLTSGTLLIGNPLRDLEFEVPDDQGPLVVKHLRYFGIAARRENVR